MHASRNTCSITVFILYFYFYILFYIITPTVVFQLTLKNRVTYNFRILLYKMIIITYIILRIKLKIILKNHLTVNEKRNLECETLLIILK